jgi:hypothetical protein
LRRKRRCKVASHLSSKAYDPLQEREREGGWVLDGDEGRSSSGVGQRRGEGRFGGRRARWRSVNWS